jgi:phage terminase small subunit
MSELQPLSPKQERFIQEYLIDLNATAAYKRAGYKTKAGPSTENAASRLLGNVRVQSAIKAAREKQAKQAELTAVEVLTEARLIVHSDIGDIIDFTGPEPRLRPANEIPERARRAISSMKVKHYVEGQGDTARLVEIVEFKLWNKPAAIEKLGRHLGLWGDKEQRDPNVVVNINIEDVVRARARVLEYQKAIAGPVPVQPVVERNGQGGRGGREWSRSGSVMANSTGATAWRCLRDRRAAAARRGAGRTAIRRGERLTMSPEDVDRVCNDKTVNPHWGPPCATLTVRVLLYQNQMWLNRRGRPARCARS